MNQETIKAVRDYLDLSQREFASDLGISLKALQSYEQGWRNVPAAIEKKILFYLAVLNRKAHPDIRDCWEIKKCGEELRGRCITGVIGAGKECWFVSGNTCGGAEVRNWLEKRKICFECEVFLQHLEILKGTALHKKILSA